MSKTVPQFAEGELVNITVRGARVSEVSQALDGSPVVDLVTSHVLRLPLAMRGVTVERVAPEEWPPQVDDVWKDHDGRKWFGGYDRDAEEPMLFQASFGWRRASSVLNDYGPMSLAYREGWSPAADTAPAASAPEQVDQRAELVAGLRELLNLLESNPHLPAPNSVRAQYSYPGSDETQRAEIERDAAAAGLDLRSWTVRDDTGDTAISADLVLTGHVLYTLYARIAGPAAPELTDAQLDAAEAEPDAAPAGCGLDDRLDERAAAEPSIDSDAFDATCGPVPPLKDPFTSTRFPGVESAYTEPGDAERTAVVEEDAAERAALERELADEAEPLPHRVPDRMTLAEALADAQLCGYFNPGLKWLSETTYTDDVKVGWVS